MNNIKLLSISIAGLLICASCADSTGEDIQMVKELQKNSLDLSLDLVKEFAMSHSNGEDITTRSTEDIHIIKHEVKTFKFDLPKQINNLQHKSLNTKNSISGDVNIYTLFFEKGGKQGYTIVSPDERINKVYAYVENGAISDTSYNVGLASLIYSIPLQCKKDLIDYYKIKETAPLQATTNLKIQPVLTYIWDQGYPYNKYAPACSSGGDHGHAWAGCVPVACAMALAHIQPDYLEQTYKVSQMLDSYTPNVINENCSWYIAGIGSMVGVKYGCDGSSANIQSICSYLNKWSIPYLYKKENVDINKALNSLKIGRPVIAQGIRKDTKKGHAWLWTGIDCVVDSNNNLVKFNSFYCSWGWGGRSNGWFSSYEQPDPNKPAYLADNANIYFR